MHNLKKESDIPAVVYVKDKGNEFIAFVFITMRWFQLTNLHAF